MKLYGYQQSAIEVFTRHGYKKALFEWPRRSGKTFISLSLMNEWVKDGGKYVFVTYYPKKEFLSRFEKYTDFTTFDLINPLEIKIKEGIKEKIKESDGVIVDEMRCHPIELDTVKKLKKIAIFTTPLIHYDADQFSFYMSNNTDCFYQSLTIHELGDKYPISTQDIQEEVDSEIIIISSALAEFFCYKYSVIHKKDE